MPGARTFSEAEREIALQIIRRYGEVSAACGNECRQKLGRYVSDKSLRDWRNESLKPKRSHHAKQAQSSADSAPLLANAHELDLTSTEPDNLADLPDDKQVLARLRRSALRLVKRIDDPEQVKALQGLALFKAAREVANLLREFQSVSEDVVALAPLIRQFVDACSPLGIEPAQALTDIIEHLRVSLADQKALAAGAQDINTGEQVFLSQTSEVVAQ